MVLHVYMISEFRVYFIKIFRLLILKIRKPFLRSYQKLYIKNKHYLEYKPIFVIGANRSGTGVCTKLIGGHPFILETSIDKDIKIDIDSKKLKSGHSPGFSESMHLLEELNNDGFQKLKHKALWGHPLNISYFYKEKYQDNIDISKLISTVEKAELLGKRAIIKDQLNTLRIKMLIDIFPKAKFIYVRRDLKSFMTSNAVRWFGSNVTQNELNKIIVHWTMTNLVSTLELEQFESNRFIKIDYANITNAENLDLVKKDVMSILDFLELKQVDLDYSILSNSRKFRQKQPDFVNEAINKAYSKFSKALTNLN